MLSASRKKIIYQALILAVVVLCIFTVSIWATRNQSFLNTITQYGYIGAFIISVISGFNLAIPVPASSFTPLFLSAGLSLPLLIATISIGMTVADLIGYFIGRTGRKALKTSSILPRWAKSEAWSERSNASVTGILFLYASLVPLPNELLVIPLALFGYKLRLITPVLFLGNITFNLISSLGFIGLFRFFS